MGAVERDGREVDGSTEIVGFGTGTVGALVGSLVGDGVGELVGGGQMQTQS